MNYILYNPKSHNGTNMDLIKSIESEYTESKKFDVTTLTDYKALFSEIKSDDEIVLIGGDGTVNHFINDVKDLKLPCDTYFYAAGTGNDFKNDLADKIQNNRILLNGLIDNLPTVIVNGEEHLFINGVGYGIDGYCCEEGDRLQAMTTEPVNYTSIAIKGLLFHYKTPNAKITVDGVTKEYKKVWLAPTMKGRYYGGGMIVAPNQNRFNDDHSLSNVVMYGSGKIKTLMVFPNIFKGKHIEHTEMVEVRTGHHFIVEFDKPQALQIDGETISNVLKYEVIAK